MSDDEQRFTLAEAVVELERRQCAERGHDFEVLPSPQRLCDTRDGPPIAVRCSQCQRYWTIGEST